MKTKITFRKWLSAVAFIAISLFTLAPWQSFSQSASQYGFTATTAAGAYTEITGGTSVAIMVDDALSGNINIGFTFNYCGTNYTQFKMCSNGFISLGTATTSNTWTNSLANLNIVKPVLMPLWDDLAGWTTGAAASYIVQGAAPNRVMVVQWKNWGWRGSTGSAPHISFQVKLYETTNVIEYVYKQEPAASNGGGATIGIADAAATATYLTLNNASATPTASSTTFTETIITKPATDQIYRFTPPANCSTPPSPLPTAGTVTATPGSLCLSGNVTMNFTPATPFPPVVGLTYKWQVSTTGAAGPYNDIPGATTTVPTYTTTVPVTTASYFRCLVLCNTTTTIITSSASNQVTVNNPGSPTVTPGSRCGPGSVALSAAPPAISPSATLNWYTSATGGAPINSGPTFNTPYITNNTTYHVAASAGGFSAPQTLATITTGGNGCSGGAMFNITPNVAISIDSFKALATATATNAIVNVYTRTGTYLGNEASNVGWNLVATVTVNTVANSLFNITLPTPINLTSGNITGVYINYNAAYSNITGAQNYSNADLTLTSGAGLCSLFGGVNADRGFNGSVHYRTAGCEGNRIPVLATVTTSTSVPKAAPAVVCNDALATVTLTPPAAPNNYSGYTWSPATNLYTNAAATIPYVAGTNATTVYMKTTNVGQQTYYMMAGNPALTTGCTFADTVRIHVQPSNLAIIGDPDTICNSGSSLLTLDTNAGYFPGSIQWQGSITGNVNDYADITGATNVSYTTPPLTFGNNRYYKAVVRAGAAVCESPTKYIVVANATMLGAPDSFNCGPGTVILNASIGGNGQAYWYENPTGGAPVGVGATFVTPYLATTTSYYVSAGGGVQNDVQTVGAGALTSSGTQSPFTGAWGGRKHQFMIKASELIAAGILPGSALTSIAFDVTAGAGIVYPGFTVSMKNTTTASLATAFEGSVEQVRNPANHTLTNGINTFILDNNFTWTGDNLVIQTCWSNGGSTSSAGTVRYDNITGTNNAVTRYAQGDLQTPASICGLTGGTSMTTRPKITFGFKKRCETAREEVIAYIRPQPVVDLGPNINKCVDAGAVEVLNAGVQPNVPAYLWDNGSTSQVRAITASGNYNVSVTNQYGCVGYDTILVTLRANPVVELGNDTSVCNGVSLTLNAGNDGIDYFWNTGAVTQTINVNTAGTYNVFVTNGVACTKTDTITIAMQGELPTIQGIAVNNNGQYTFTFSAINPQNVIGYEWDFGDGSLPSYQQSPTHTYPDAGNYIVVLKLSSSCGFKNDSTSAHIVGLNQLNVDNGELSVYPNPTKGQATILSKGALKMEKIEVYNILGQQVYSADADSKDKHSLDLDRLASGVYTIQVFTDKGNVARKLEILK